MLGSLEWPYIHGMNHSDIVEPGWAAEGYNNNNERQFHIISAADVVAVWAMLQMRCLTLSPAKFCKQAKLDSCAFLCASLAWPVDAVEAPRLCVGQPGSVSSLCASLNDSSVLSAVNIPARACSRTRLWLKCDNVCYASLKSITSLIPHSVMVGSRFWLCANDYSCLTCSACLSLHISLVHRLPLVPFAAYYIGKLSVGFGFLVVCAVDMCPPHHPWWIIHLQADERRAGEVRSAEVEWPWFLLAAGHLAIALVIIHASQMAFLWASVKRTGQGLSCQVPPGPKTAGRGVVGLCRRTWWAPRNVWSDRAETNHRRLGEIFCLIGGAHAAKEDSQGRRRSLKTKKPSHLISTFDKLLSASLRPVTFIPAAVFSATATSHSKTVCRLFVAIPPPRLSVLRI